MMQLRRISDQVQLRRITDRVAKTGAEAASQVGQKLTEAGRRGNEVAQSAYSYAMSHRKATAAVVLGAGVAAALLWMMQRNGGYSATRRRVVRRVRATTK